MDSEALRQRLEQLTGREPESNSSGGSIRLLFLLLAQIRRISRLRMKGIYGFLYMRMRAVLLHYGLKWRDFPSGAAAGQLCGTQLCRRTESNGVKRRR